MHRFKLNCIHLDQNPETLIESRGHRVEISHRDGEPLNANRIRITRGSFMVEILPSKGFSIGEFTLDGKPVFWDPPIGLPDPDSLDFESEDIYIFGEQVKGFEFLKTFVGGIELMGMKNWGMPYTDPNTGDSLPLHGEAGNIPLEWVEFEVSDEGLTARGSYVYRTMEGNEDKVWYERGEEMYRLTRTLILDNEVAGFSLADSIQNIGGEAMKPDWGYHVTFHPEPGSRIHIASRQLEERGGGSIPADHDTWQPAPDEKLRSEIGIIHKGLYSEPIAGIPTTRILKEYPDGRAFELMVPVSPYFQTWFSNGGIDTDEFTYKDGGRLFSKSWNGFGIEFGSSPLDHNGNTDPNVTIKSVLQPGEKTGIVISIRLLDDSGAEVIKSLIENYNSDRILKE